MGTIIHLPSMVQKRLPVPITKPIAQPPALREPKPQGHNEGVKIVLLILRCPMTAHDIEAGIEMDSQTFQRIGRLTVRLRCRACHCTHELKVADGTLAPYGLPPFVGDLHPNWQPPTRRATHGNSVKRPKAP